MSITKKLQKISRWRRFLPERWREPKPVVAVLRLSGVIGAVSPLKQGLNLHDLDEAIEKAFEFNALKAVALEINSPGGSPVQSSLIYRRIRELAAEKEIRVFAFAEDVAASGGYMLALAGDEIYADASSIIGSIGVISAGFGFVEAIDKLGIERRVYTAGERKMSLDPFSPESKDDVERLKALQRDVHETFKAMVTGRRGEKLKRDDLFTGEFWSGSRAVELGLIDGLADLRSFMKEKYGDNVKFKPVIAEKGWLKRKLSLSQNTSLLPENWAEDLISAAQTRSLWSRFGL